MSKVFNLSRSSRLIVTSLPKSDFLEADGITNKLGYNSAGGATKWTGTLPAFSPKNTFRINILDGYNFGQQTTSQEVTITEAGRTPIRGQKIFNTALEPAEVSFSTYARPFILGNTTGNIYSAGANDFLATCGEAVLWASFVQGAALYDDGGQKWTLPANDLVDYSSRAGDAAIAIGGTNYTNEGINATKNFLSRATEGDSATAAVASDLGFNIDFKFSNVHELYTLQFIFVLDKTAYLVTDVMLNEVTLNFDIEGIGTLEWSGQGKGVVEYPALYELFGEDKVADGTGQTHPGTKHSLFGFDNTGTVSIGELNILTPVPDILNPPPSPNWANYCSLCRPTPDNADFLKTKLSGVLVASRSLTVNNDFPKYNLALTGGNITITNNVTYLTPEELAKVNKPIGAFTGTRTVSGTINAYLCKASAGDPNRYTAELLGDIASDTNTVTHNFDIYICVGGGVYNESWDSADGEYTSPPTAEEGTILFHLSSAHLTVPTFNVEDVLSTEIQFTGLGSDGNISNADEVTIMYTPTAVSSVNTAVELA